MASPMPRSLAPGSRRLRRWAGLRSQSSTTTSIGPVRSCRFSEGSATRGAEVLDPEDLVLAVPALAQGETDSQLGEVGAEDVLAVARAVHPGLDDLVDRGLAE